VNDISCRFKIFYMILNTELFIKLMFWLDVSGMLFHELFEGDQTRNCTGNSYSVCTMEGKSSYWNMIILCNFPKRLKNIKAYLSDLESSDYHLFRSMEFCGPYRFVKITPWVHFFQCKSRFEVDFEGWSTSSHFFLLQAFL